MLHNTKSQIVTTYGVIAVGQTFQGQFLPQSSPSGSAPIAGHTDVSLISQLYACVASRINPLKGADEVDVASAAFLAFFGSYLIIHIANAWPRIAEALAL